MHSSPRYIGQEQTSNIPKQMYQLEQDNRNSKTKVQLQTPKLVGNTLEKENQLYHTTKDNRWKIEEGSELHLDPGEHISDRLHRTAFLVRKSKYNRNNWQNDLSNYASSASSLVREHKLKIDLIHSQFIQDKQQNPSIIQSMEKACKCGNRKITTIIQ